MNALALMATLGLDSQEYEQGLGKAKKDAGSFASYAKKIIAGVATAKAAKTAIKSIVNITKMSVQAYANYEQLIGGVETLFGTSAQNFDEYAEKASESLYKMGQRGDDVKKLQEELIANGYDIGASGADGIYGPKTQAAFDAYAKAGGQMVKDAWENANSAKEIVIENAKQAYLTAGMDMNTYMGTVTGFSAALLKSLGGDTVRAAEMADMAIQDMSDNANKMGTSTESIVNAYQGFSRQNYTMLDNLKLGYGGTKSEMERLIKDAEGLDESFKASRDSNGELTLSYGDIVQAIHIVQDEMGITGTTAKEASETISGSLSSLQAAWQNTLIAFGTGDENEIERTMGALVDSAVTFVDNLTPIIENALTAIGQFILAIAPIIKEKLPPLIRKTLPTLLNALKELVTGLITALPSILAAVWESVHDLLNQESENIAKILKDMFGIEIDAEQITAALEAVLGGILTYHAVAGVIGLINGLTAAFETFKAVGLAGLLGNPVALAIGAAAAAVMYLWNTSEDFRNVVGEIWDAISALITDPVGTINQIIQDGLAGIQAFWDKCVELGDAIGGIWEDIKTATVEKWNAIVEPIQNAINKVLEFLGLKAKAYDESYVGDTGPVLPGYENPYQSSGGIKINPYMDAVSMSGRIYNHMTPFGVDENGRMHVAGDAGPEAVVGTSSLNQMIQQSVNNALGGAMAPVVEAMRNMRLVADTGEVLAWLAPSMDEELNTLATWKEGGRA